MKHNVKKSIKTVDTTGWKKVALEFGPDFLDIAVPQGCVELSMKDVPALADPGAEIQKVLSNPTHSPTLGEIVRKKAKPAGRPVRGDYGLRHHDDLFRIEGKRGSLFRFSNSSSLRASGDRTYELSWGREHIVPAHPRKKSPCSGRLW